MIISKMDYMKKTREELERLKAKMETLQQKAETMTGDVREKYLEELRRLEIKFQSIVQELREMELATGDTWRPMKTGIEKSMGDFKNTIHGISAQYTM